MARVRVAEPMTPVDGVPVELTDRDAVVWHDQAAYLGFMAGQGWPLPPSERLGVVPSPRRRRQHAVSRWAVSAGIVSARGAGWPDWHRLRSMGLL